MSNDQFPDRLLERASRPIEAPATEACLDPETLAAWTDGTLPSPRREAAEAHAADCDRCLAMLAAMAKTTPPATVARGPRWHTWRWLVPIATAAVALTTWITMRELPTPERSAAPAAAQTATPIPPPARSEAPVGETAAIDRIAPVPREETRQRKDTAKAVVDETKTVPEPSARTPPPPAAAPAAERAAAAAQFRAFGPVVITSPDPNVQWRLSGSSVEKSRDAGRTWQQQPVSGSAALMAGSAVLLAGSSPAPTICWIVGQAGTVLVTTDGETWRRVNIPDPKTHLRSVAASDGSTATVTTVDGRVYVTSDGGLTWRLQENRPAPF